MEYTVALYMSCKAATVRVKMLKFSTSIKQFIYINIITYSWYTSILIFHETNKHSQSLIVSLRDMIIQISWFLIREILEVANSVIQCHSVVLNLQTRSTRDCGVLIWSPVKCNVSRENKRHKHWNSDFGQSPSLGIEGSTIGTPSPDFERDFYDLGLANSGTRRAAELLKSIFDHD